MAARKTTTATRSKGGNPESKSAAGRAAVLAPTVAERRAAPRLTLTRAEAGVVAIGLRVTVLEVGFGGLSIESGHEFHVGEIHRLSDGRSAETSAVFRARVKHCRRQPATHEPARYVTGFEFVDEWC